MPIPTAIAVFPKELPMPPRKALFKYKLHADEDLFEKAFRYVREYY